MAYKDKERGKEYIRRWRAANKDKVTSYYSTYDRKNRAKKNARLRADRIKHPERYRAYDRKKVGLPEPTRPEPQHCEACGCEPSRTICLDHDHGTGAFRGWLCNNCNVGIGMFGDSIERLERAILYLKNFGGPA